MPAKKTKKILIAEDEKPMARAMELKFTKEGFSVEVAHNGADALKKIKDTSFDLILLDLMMPIKDGFGVLEDMKKNKIHIPTIITSNLSQPEDQKRAKELGAVDFLVKSDTPLVDIVKKVKKKLSMT